MDVRDLAHTVKGRIGYYATLGAVTGHEDFAVQSFVDGGRRLRADCVMADRSLLRRCELTLDADGRPTAASVRTKQAGALLGVGFYTFDEGGVRARLSDASGDTRVIEQRTAERPRFFGTHSLINDGWLALLGDDMESGETRRLSGLMTCSLDADGGGPPDLLESEARLTRLGEEMVATPVGALACQGWSVRYGDYPALTMWLTQPDCLLTRMSWTHLDGYYMLDELEGDSV